MWVSSALFLDEHKLAVAQDGALLRQQGFWEVVGERVKSSRRLPTFIAQTPSEIGVSRSFF
jgi:hypothetical protein